MYNAEVVNFNVYVKQGIVIFWMEILGLLKGGATLDELKICKKGIKSNSPDRDHVEESNYIYMFIGSSSLVYFCMASNLYRGHSLSNQSNTSLQ